MVIQELLALQGGIKNGTSQSIWNTLPFEGRNVRGCQQNHFQMNEHRCSRI